MRCSLLLFLFCLASSLPAQVRTFTLADTVFEKGSVMRIEILYDFNHSGPRPESYALLDSINTFLKKHPGLVLEIGTHTDQRGADAFNLKLSASRARAVYDWLVGGGGSPDQLVDSGYGETQPVYTQAMIDKDTSKQGKEKMYQANRRTILKILRVPDCFFALNGNVFTPSCIFRTHRITWTLGKVELSPDCYPLLDSVAVLLFRQPQLVVEIGCHTDSRGAASSNQALSMNRARTIFDYLVRVKNVPGHSLQYNGYGESELLLADKQLARRKQADVEAGHQLNRRTEFKILRVRQHAVLPPTPYTTFTLNDSIFAEGSRLVTYRILFDLNKSTLRPESMLYLDTVAAFLLKYPYLVVEIANHTDARTSPAYSSKLSQRRAEAIANYLVTKGVPAGSVIPKGYEGTKPRRLPDGTVLTEKYILSKPSKEEQEELHRQNRRTEIKIVEVK
jgi:outer membrane protein OmpA-like peptidoglycan-associated protein